MAIFLWQNAARIFLNGKKCHTITPTFKNGVSGGGGAAGQAGLNRGLLHGPRGGSSALQSLQHEAPDASAYGFTAYRYTRTCLRACRSYCISRQAKEPWKMRAQLLNRHGQLPSAVGSTRAHHWSVTGARSDRECQASNGHSPASLSGFPLINKLFPPNTQTSFAPFNVISINVNHSLPPYHRSSKSTVASFTITSLFHVAGLDCVR